MKRYVKVLLVVIAVLAIAAFPVLAQSQQPPDQSVIDLLVELLTGLGIPISLPGLAAIAAFFNIVVNVLKQVKIDGNPLIPDDWGGFVVLAAEVAAVAVAAIAGYYEFDLASVAGILDTLGKLLLSIAGLFGFSLLYQIAGRKAKLPFYRERTG